MRLTKYIKGDRIKTMGQFAKEIQGGRYIYWRHKPQHPGWLMSLQYRVLVQAIDAGILFKSIKREE